MNLKKMESWMSSVQDTEVRMHRYLYGNVREKAQNFVFWFSTAKLPQSAAPDREWNMAGCAQSTRNYFFTKYWACKKYVNFSQNFISFSWVHTYSPSPTYSTYIINLLFSFLFESNFCCPRLIFYLLAKMLILNLATLDFENIRPGSADQRSLIFGFFGRPLGAIQSRSQNLPDFGFSAFSVFIIHFIFFVTCALV